MRYVWRPPTDGHRLNLGSTSVGMGEEFETEVEIVHPWAYLLTPSPAVAPPAPVVESAEPAPKRPRRKGQN